MNSEQLERGKELNSKIEALENAKKHAEEYVETLSTEKKDSGRSDYWGTFAEHSDGSGMTIPLNGTYVVKRCVKAIKDILADELEKAEKEFAEL